MAVTALENLKIMGDLVVDQPLRKYTGPVEQIFLVEAPTVEVQQPKAAQGFKVIADHIDRVVRQPAAPIPLGAVPQ